MRLFFKIALSLVILTACRKENRFDCFTANGPDVTELRSNGRFDSIEVRDKFDVTIVKGSEYKVEVTAGKHVIRNISTEIKDGQLIIENRNTCNFVRGYKRKFKVRVTTPYVKRVFNNGVGPVAFDDNFKQDTLIVRAESSGVTYINGNYAVVYSSSHGNGDVYLSGKARELLIYTNGTNYTQAADMVVSDHIFISTYSIGDSYFNLNGVKKFEFYIWKSGNIYYKGTPGSFVNLSDGSGKGKAIRQD